jgi:MFS family permease
MKNRELTKIIANIFGGSAVAGMGFSLGSDIYSNTKRNREFRGKILAIAVIGFAIAGAYFGGVLIARNYKAFWSGFLNRLLGVVTLVPSFVILSLFSAFVFEMFAHEKHSTPSSKLQTTYSEKGIEVRRAIPVTGTFPANPVQDTDSGIVVRRAIPVSSTPVDRNSKNTSNGYNTKSISPHPKGVSLSLFILPSFIFGIGLFSGFFQRKKRKNICDGSL